MGREAVLQGKVNGSFSLYMGSASLMDPDGSDSDGSIALEALVQREDDDDNIRDIFLDATNESDLEEVKEYL